MPEQRAGRSPCSRGHCRMGLCGCHEVQSSDMEDFRVSRHEQRLGLLVRCVWLVIEGAEEARGEEPAWLSAIVTSAVRPLASAVALTEGSQKPTAARRERIPRFALSQPPREIFDRVPDAQRLHSSSSWRLPLRVGSWEPPRTSTGAPVVEIEVGACVHRRSVGALCPHCGGVYNRTCVVHSMFTATAPQIWIASAIADSFKACPRCAEGVVGAEVCAYPAISPLPVSPLLRKHVPCYLA